MSLKWFHERDCCPCSKLFFIFLVIGIASALLSTGKIPPFVTRKVVHIGVSNWWIFAMLFFDSPVTALIGPVTFILINYISYKKHIFAAMEHEIPRKNLGTIYFPVSLTIMVLLSFAGPMPKSAAAGSLLIAAVYFSVQLLQNRPLFALFAETAMIFASGFLGAWIDSLIGATVQAKYLCSVQGTETERSRTNGQRNNLVRGFRFMTNDAVNFLSGFLSTSAAAFLLSLIYQ